MISFLKTPADLAIQIAEYAQALRLSKNLTQRSLSDRAGVSYGVIKKFERTGKISLESLLQIALVLNALDGFNNLFLPEKPENLPSLDVLLQQKTRKRGRL